MTLRIDAKCSDCCSAILLDDAGIRVAEKIGYVPSIMPDGGGDYVSLDIDVETGKILNWKVPTKKQLASFGKED